MYALTHTHTHTHTCSHTHIGPQMPDVRYTTVEVFVNRGIRINGEISTVLQAQLTPPNCKTVSDERGWYVHNNVEGTLYFHNLVSDYDYYS